MGHALTINAFFDEIEHFMDIQVQSQDATKENQRQIRPDLLVIP